MAEKTDIQKQIELVVTNSRVMNFVMRLELRTD